MTAHDIRFYIIKETDGGPKPVWAILDSLASNPHFMGPYRLRRDAQRQAARWNLDHNLALVETGRITRNEYLNRCRVEGRAPIG